MKKNPNLIIFCIFIAAVAILLQRYISRYAQENKVLKLASQKS